MTIDIRRGNIDGMYALQFSDPQSADNFLKNYAYMAVSLKQIRGTLEEMRKNVISEIERIDNILHSEAEIVELAKLMYDKVKNYFPNEVS